MSKEAPITIALCSINADKLDEKLKISPVGEDIKGIDGREFTINAQHILAELNRNGLELPLTIDHGYSAKYGGESGGWFSEYELRDDGIYAKFEPNELGRELITSKKYKYLSPEYLRDPETNHVNLIIGVGLVNQPNLLNESLNHQQSINQQPNDKEPDMAMTPEELAAQKALEAANEQLKAENEQLKTQQSTLSEEVNTMKQAQLAQKVDNAIAKGELLPAKKEFALTLEENALDSFLAIEAKGSSLTKDNHSIDPEKDDKDNIDSNDPIYSQLGL